MLAIIIATAFVAGFGFSRLGYPPLLGYLLSGFVAAGLGLGTLETIQPIADLGILLLLFTIGIKLNLRQLAAIQVWGVTFAHALVAMVISAPIILVIALTIPDLALSDARSIWTIAFALSFSSTVFAVKIFESRGEGASFHAAIAIGILIIQDLMAVIYLVLSSGKWPSLWAPGLLLLPLSRPLLHRLLQKTGHNELLILFGMVMALGGAALFEAVHLKAGLGALAAGLLISNSPRASELYKNLIGFKDLFLIGFFLQIGYYGLPTVGMLVAAIILALLVVLRPVIYFLLFSTTRLRARTGFLASIALFNYSEFGLIVGAIAMSTGAMPERWMTVLAIALALSFFLASPLNARANRIYRKVADRLRRFEKPQRLPEEVIAGLGDAEVVVLGMGRVGLGVYEYLTDNLQKKVIGVDESRHKAAQLSSTGVNCIHGDANDDEFWSQTDLSSREMLFVSLTNHRENLALVRLARERDFNGVIAVVSRYPDESLELEQLGCVTFNLYAEAGHGFAEHVVTGLNKLSDKQAGK